MPEPGQVVTRFETPQGPVTLRYLRPGDAPALLRYINDLSQERTFTTLQGEVLTLAEEEAWLAGQIAGLAAGDVVNLVLDADGRIVGNASIARRPRTERHVAGLAIAVSREYRGAGLGRRLLQAVLQEAERHLAGVRLVILDVFATNRRAIRLYEEMGFVEYGRLPGGIMHHGQPVDKVSMVRPMVLVRESGSGEVA